MAESPLRFLPRQERSTEVLLLFPPLTEARLFPYLSLPRLTAYLRKAGLTVQQQDLNIDLAHRLFSPAQLRAYIRDRQRDEDLKARYRVKMAHFLLRYHAELLQSLQSKIGKSFDMRAVVRFVRQGVDLLTADSAYMHPALSISGLIEQASMLMQGGHKSDPTSAVLCELTLEALTRFRPRMVAISVPFYSQLLPSLHLAGLVKTHDADCKVILGGPQIILYQDQLAQSSGVERFIDGLGLGAGEATLVSLAYALRDGDDVSAVPGLRCLPHRGSAEYSRPQRIPLDALPAPDFSSLPLNRYLSDEVQLPLTTCVGCYWGRCCFCSYGNRHHKDGSYEEMSPSKIAETCLDLIARYSIRRINFVDENTNLKLVLRAVQKINAAGEQITFSTRNRLDGILLRREFCAELAARGCVLMSSGYETNSQRLLDAMDKGIRACNYQPIIDNLHRVGIDLRLSVMGGILDESREELENSIAFLRKNEAKIGIDVMQMLVAEPRTYLTDNPRAYGIRIATDTRLRGNKMLNFCYGRMGAKVIYPDGDTYDRRLTAFLDVFYKVQPLKNDELSPGRIRSGTKAAALHGQSGTTACAETSTKKRNAHHMLKLNPWMCILPATESRSLLVDLLWQRFYWLSPTLTSTKNDRYLRTRNPSGIGVLQRLEDVGAGKIRGGKDTNNAVS